METKAQKARRYLAEGRLKVLTVRPMDVNGRAPIIAECRGSDTVYTLGYDSKLREWRCTCEASATFHRECAHIVALKLVTVRPER